MDVLPITSVTVSGKAAGRRRLAIRRDGAGRPVLFLHGIPTSSLLWRHVQPVLSAEADTIAVDLLGYGRSDKPPEVSPTLPVQLELLADLVRTLDLRDVLVVGHDIGGGIAQLLATAAPDRISGLVLIDSIAYDSFPEPTIKRMADPSWDERIQQLDLAAGLRRALRRGLTEEEQASEELAAMYAAPFEGTEGRAAYLRAARALHTEDLDAMMPNIEALRIPVHIVWGAEDTFQPLSFGERLAKALPQAQLTVIANGRHFLPEDHPAELARILSDALEHG